MATTTRRKRVDRTNKAVRDATTLANMLTDYVDLTSPEDVIVAAGDLLHQIETVAAEVRADRQIAVKTLRTQGVLWREIGELTGLSRARLNQILRGVNGGDHYRQRAI